MKKIILGLVFLAFTAFGSVTVDSDLSGVPSSGGGEGGAFADITGEPSDNTALASALDGKVNDTGDETIAGVKTFSSAPICSALTANTVPYLNGSKVLTSSAVTPTELGYVSGVTSAIQTQLGTKAPTASPTFTGTTTVGTGGIAWTTTGVGTLGTSSIGVGTIYGRGASGAQYPIFAEFGKSYNSTAGTAGVTIYGTDSGGAQIIMTPAGSAQWFEIVNTADNTLGFRNSTSGSPFITMSGKNINVTGAINSLPTTTAVTADNQSINVANLGAINLTSDDGTAANRTFTLTGWVAGQTITLILNDTSGAVELVDSASIRLVGDTSWTPDDEEGNILRLFCPTTGYCSEVFRSDVN